MSTFGTLFRVTTYGESHCASVGAIIDGCPPVSPLPSPDFPIDRPLSQRTLPLGTFCRRERLLRDTHEM